MDVFATWSAVLRTLTRIYRNFLFPAAPNEATRVALIAHSKIVEAMDQQVASARVSQTAPDLSLVLQAKDSFSAAGNGSPAYRPWALWYSKALLSGLIPTYLEIHELVTRGQPSAGASFLLAPDGVVDLATGGFFRTDRPINAFWGSQKASTSSQRYAPMKTPGDVAEALPGVYTGTQRMSQPWGPDDPISTIRAAIPGTAIFVGNPVGGSDTFYIEWAGHALLSGLVFTQDDRATLKTENPLSARWANQHPSFPDIYIIDCLIGTGGLDTRSWNAETNAGYRNGSWGVHAYDVGTSDLGNALGWIERGMCNLQLDDRLLRWDPTWDPDLGFPGAEVWEGGVFREHRGYQHSTRAPGRELGYKRIRWNGRTADQNVWRAGESQLSDGLIWLHHLELEDCCLEQGGGGSYLTYKGHAGRIEIHDIVARLGMNPALHPSVSDNITGLLVLEYQHQNPVHYCSFDHIRADRGAAFAGKNSARRPMVSIEAVELFEMGPNVRLIDHQDPTGNSPTEVLSIGDPNLGMTNIGPLRLNERAMLNGIVRYGGQRFHDPSLTGAGWSDFKTAVKANPAGFPQIELVP